jgi:hypothetical protein
MIAACAAEPGEFEEQDGPPSEDAAMEDAAVSKPPADLATSACSCSFAASRGPERGLALIGILLLGLRRSRCGARVLPSAPNVCTLGPSGGGRDSRARGLRISASVMLGERVTARDDEDR